jgi:glycosyltransferase involved in cell wall biosynthesis
VAAVVVHVLPTARPQAAALAGIVHGLVENLDRRRYTPEVWFLDRGGPLESGFRERGVAVRALDWRGIRGSAAASFRLVRTIAAVRPAYLHLHAGGGTLPILGRLARAGCVIVHQHGRVRDERRAGPEVFRANGAHLVIANSRATAACVRHPRVRIVHPGTPPGPEHVRADPDSGGPVIGTACRLVPIKGVSVLLEAFARLSAEFPRARLEVAGTGPEEVRLRDAAAARGVAERVRFLGWVRDLPAVSAAWQVFVLPSLEEAFGIAAVEAMHLGLPVVATHAGGLPEVVEHGVTGLLVPPGDPSALAAAIGELLRSAAYRRTLGDAGRRRARERFGTEAMAAAMAAVYQEMEAEREAAQRRR